LLKISKNISLLEFKTLNRDLGNAPKIEIISLINGVSLQYNQINAYLKNSNLGYWLLSFFLNRAFGPHGIYDFPISILCIILRLLRSIQIKIL